MVKVPIMISVDKEKMVEKSHEPLTTPEKMLATQQQASKEALVDSDSIPAEMVAAAEMQLAHFLSIKREVAHIMDQIMEKIESLKRVIHVNVWNEDHPAGVLTNKEE